MIYEKNITQNNPAEQKDNHYVTVNLGVFQLLRNPGMLKRLYAEIL